MSAVQFAESRPVARKAHRCNMCARMIAPGETYWASRNIYDGRVYTWKTCAHCDAAITATSLGDYLYDCDYDGDGYGPDDVAEWEPQDRRECVIKSQWKRGWRYYNGPARPRRPEFPAYYSNRLRPDDSCPLVPVPSAAKEVDA